jgi:hypothetical protein
MWEKNQYEKNTEQAARLTRFLIQSGAISTIPKESFVRSATTDEDQNRNTDCVIITPRGQELRVGYRTYPVGRHEFTISREDEGRDTEFQKIRRGFCPDLYVIDTKEIEGRNATPVRRDVIVLDTAKMNARGYFAGEGLKLWRHVRKTPTQSFMAIKLSLLYDDGLFIFSGNTDTTRPWYVSGMDQQ